jgi:hypothetical protein
MAVTVKLDMLESLPTAVDNHGGSQVSLRARATGLTSSTGDGALAEALNDSAMPQLGGKLTAFPGVVLATRVPMVMKSSPQVVDVMLTYVTRGSPIARYLMGIATGFGSPSAPGSDFQAGGGGSLQQEPQSVDLFGNEMLVSHTFAADDKVLERRGKTQTQGGSPSVDQVSLTTRFSGPLAMAYPNFFALLWLNHTNLFTWQGNPPNSWKCVQADFDLINSATTPSTFRWDFAFQFNVNGWFKQVSFKDDTDGLPPAGLVPGVGTRLYQVYPGRNFGELFPI